MLLQRLLADHGDGFVRRKIVAVILQREQIERRNQAISGVTRSNVDLMIFECRSQQTQIHYAWWSGKVQAVSRSQSRISIGTLHEFIAKTGMPLGSERGRLRQSFDMQAARVCTTN